VIRESLLVPADYSRIHRLLRIVTLIQSQEGWTAERLARECQVTPRTLFRDMAILESVGIPYFHDPVTKGYRIHRDFFMPPVELSLDEALAVVALGEHIGNREQVPLTRAAGKAIDKIRANLPRSIQDELGKLERHIAIELARTTPPEGIADVYDKVRHAIARKRALTCSYESIKTSLRDDNAGSELFEFHPYALLFAQRAWYAVGHHCGRNAVRTLKLNRFTVVTPGQKPYAIPDGFDLHQHLGHAWRMIRGERRYDVAIRFDPQFADTVSDTHWHPTQKTEFHDEDGSVTLRFSVDGLDEIVWWVLSMGPYCQVLEPAELIQRVRELAQGVVERYSETTIAAGGSGSDTADDAPPRREKRPAKPAANRRPR
jgi:predicted DNA-binding transcriptional regulator YafY